jgi:hypothetical protein
MDIDVKWECEGGYVGGRSKAKAVRVMRRTVRARSCSAEQAMDSRRGLFQSQHTHEKKRQPTKRLLNKNRPKKRRKGKTCSGWHADEVPRVLKSAVDCWRTEGREYRELERAEVTSRRDAAMAEVERITHVLQQQDQRERGGWGAKPLAPLIQQAGRGASTKMWGVGSGGRKGKSKQTKQQQQQQQQEKQQQGKMESARERQGIPPALKRKCKERVVVKTSKCKQRCRWRRGTCMGTARTRSKLRLRVVA